MTPFRRKVMETLARLPAGEVTTYGGLARTVGRAGAARAVGRVMATNPWPLIVPCHRVVGTQGLDRVRAGPADEALPAGAGGGRAAPGAGLARLLKGISCGPFNNCQL